ncbi:RsmE family RNA methyltransferase [Roseibacillus ishigakijimensis]|uniref:Ribosomal RNA small subunit methyltransferase E n=1 Tax=Roseibacillus ishigakijimensis TaxID=454146 RepID=A0A934RVI6_9BACT|nr:RsmE family RNA methyltransferase [Roseibacillus ishigakijimensis]MBK1834930.1 16S rRNA (uracil(1498)-N(3))-methyltransferase [Roseibacillus ishigakijimensis]
MDRFYLPPAEWTPGELVLAGEEGHHAVRVMRKKPGDRLEVFDGAGRWARGEVLACDKSQLTLRREEEGESAFDPPRLHLAVAIPKGKTMDLVVQKAVELGVNSIQPLTTRNTVVKVSATEAADKSQKWQRVALEACKQCGQNLLPTVFPVLPIGDYLARQRAGAGLLASLAEGALPVRERLEALPADLDVLSFLVGPEGDFTGEEIAAAIASGFEPVTLGRIVLRVETACLFLLSAARYRYF